MGEYDYICLMCGESFNGYCIDGWPTKPEKCSNCKAPQSDIITTNEYEECERANKQDEMREG